MTALEPRPLDLRQNDHSDSESLHVSALASVPGYDIAQAVHRHNSVNRQNSSSAARDHLPDPDLSHHREDGSVDGSVGGATPATPATLPTLSGLELRQRRLRKTEYQKPSTEESDSGVGDGDTAISRKPLASKNDGRKILPTSVLAPLSPQVSPELVRSPDLLSDGGRALEYVRAKPGLGLGLGFVQSPSLAQSRTPGSPDESIDPLNFPPRRPRLNPVLSMPATPAEEYGEWKRSRNFTPDLTKSNHSRPAQGKRALSTPAAVRGISSTGKGDKARVGSLASEASRNEKARPKAQPAAKSQPSPMSTPVPLPPLSIPAYLQLELSSQRPAEPFIRRSDAADFPYESSRAKLERLVNFLLLPWHLESVLWFGMLACIDSWLYTFTILPLRLLKSFYMLGQSWSRNLVLEADFLSHFVYRGAGRMWKRRRMGEGVPGQLERKQSQQDERLLRKARTQRHGGRSKAVPSMLLPDDKADMLKGLLIICTSLVLLQLDASRMYHWVRGQAAIKLYVIYNILEVCDRLFSAIGQDVLECLFSREALERGEDGRSKILRPSWLFILALIYTVIHSIALFYQVITLNVAVNSYSNALITLLMSNQFVEIKSTVFKKFEKENLFQLTCADVVERFQLWHMLLIIASRNIAETGGIGRAAGALGAASPSSSSSSSSSLSMAGQASNASLLVTAAVPPVTASSILPKAFTIVPSMVSSITTYVPTVNHVLGPFLIVMGSEMLVDWLKHAYINKFNNTRPAIYDRFLDVLAKDYYTNAFGDQNLTKRLGLPLIPLSCILIRASAQIYPIFMAVWMPPSQTSLSSSLPTTLAAIQEQFTSTRDAKATTSSPVAIARRLDHFLGGLPSAVMDSRLTIALMMTLVAVLLFMLLLACKLVLGMLLLAFARARYRSMKETAERGQSSNVEGGRRVGGWGMVEVGEDKRAWIYEDDPAGLQTLHERERAERARHEREKREAGGAAIEAFDRVNRYEMVAKRIW